MSTKQTPEEVEEVKDLEKVEEVQDLKEVPEEVKEVQELTEVPEEVKAPVLRGGGLRGAADPDMIQTHIDNFLAMLCGETPVDSNVRTSAEYWLKRLATGEGAGSTKKIYWHTVKFVRSGETVYYSCGYIIIINNDPTPITTSAFYALLDSPGFYGVVINGFTGETAGGDETSITRTIEGIYRYSDSYFGYISRDLTTHATTEFPVSKSGYTVTDLGVNPIN